MQEVRDHEGYKGDIVAGSLLIVESQAVAGLLLESMDKDKWQQAIVKDNVLQKRSPTAALRQTRLIKNRLDLMGPELWRMIHKGTYERSTQAILAAAIKHSRLLGDYMESVVRDNWRTFNHKLTQKDWRNFLESCAQADQRVASWTQSTRAKLKQIVFRILAEAKYIENTRSGIIQSVTVLPEIKDYLTANDESYVLRCMQATQVD